MIELHDVSKSFTTGSEQVEVLKNVTLSIKEGEFVGIIGPSGSGKTTLLNVMGLLEDASSGEVWVSGEKTNDLSSADRKRIRNNHISYVFQQYQLLPALTAIENVMLPVLQFKKNKTVVERAESLLEQVGLAERRNHLPAKLSGGEQQRVAIARALMSDPAIILADEMTGNLDEDTSKEIMQLFKGIHEKEGKTIVMVTHNMDLIEYTENAYQIRRGTLSKVDEQTAVGGCSLPSL